MKKILTLAAAVFLSGNIFGQIGINTDTPKTGSVLHVDPAGNTTGSSGISDDVIVDQEGKLGIGTTSPDTKVHLIGKFRMTDGYQDEEQALISDENGVGSWQTLSLGNMDSEWEVTATTQIPDESLIDISGTATFIHNRLGATTDNVSTITIPPGRYVIFVRGNIEIIKDYGTMRVYEGQNEIYNVPYGEYLSGAAIYKEFTSEAVLSIKYSAIDVGSTATNGQILFLSPLPYTIPETGSTERNYMGTLGNTETPELKENIEYQYSMLLLSLLSKSILYIIY